MVVQKRIYVVIPAYQAAQTLESVFERIPREIYEKDVRIVVVNDGSSDATGDIARKIAQSRANVEVIDHPQNRGYAQAQKTGFSYALAQGAEIAALLHADGQYAPELLPRLLTPLERDEADVVIGSRMLERGALKGGMPLYKYIANKALTAVENLAYGLRVSEYHSGYMLYSRKCLQTIPFVRLSDTFHFDGEMIMMAGKRKLRIKEIAIPTRYADEKSHLKPVQYGFDVLKIIWHNYRGKYEF
ncbi:glycosyltransferase family 2 protein [Sinorhizobium numidicum]|uniref:Glycosyltransferase family 2 protein n=1 Tax=Sinorhizobium numidicum TaxID=680248 RepID=A0ABY8CSJ6_9HYPH|nr:glycosyltransferase family 2 protein [Sinorhizobium numidicum]WEX75618.1 glycosyltransferase family 2 protein [Sinorhizobium numidicum]WEX81615.1 glycosyltransferase family 2 protein [Sinorhizobium numidicum]